MATIDQPDEVNMKLGDKLAQQGAKLGGLFVQWFELCFESGAQFGDRSWQVQRLISRLFDQTASAGQISLTRFNGLDFVLNHLLLAEHLDGREQIGLSCCS